MATQEPRITFNVEQCGGRPCIRGMRIRVSDVLELLANGLTREQVLQELGVDYVDESEVLTPADEAHHVDKHAFKVPFVCGARNLGEALRRIGEGAALIRTKGEAGTGDVVHAVKHMRQIMTEMRQLTVMGDDELSAAAKNLQAPY